MVSAIGREITLYNQITKKQFFCKRHTYLTDSNILNIKGIKFFFMVLFGIFLVPDYNDFHIFEEFSCIVENVEYHQTKCETSKKTTGPSRIWCWYDIIYN